jgi:uncharacterized protein
VPKLEPGQIGWVDLTTPEAEGLRDFYAKVTGWKSSPVDMGGYQDYCMNAKDGKTVAGICHARGQNAGLPPVWMVYIVVEDLDKSLRACVKLGGVAPGEPRVFGGEGRYAVIRDPSGTAAALFEPAGPRIA